jgi:hypothetical protein
MMQPDPHKAETEQTVSDRNHDAHGSDEVPDPGQGTIRPHKEEHQPYYGWNLRYTTPYQKANIAIMLLICAVTAIYAYFSYLQWVVLHNSMKLDQRAWVGVSGVTANVKNDEPATFSIKIKNTGKTPANNVTGICRFEIVPQNGFPDFTKLRSLSGETKNIIPPLHDVTLTFDTGFCITNDVINQVTNGMMQTYIYGVIRYHDIFGYRHWTTFCYYFSPDMTKYYPYKEHNDIDNN